MSERAWTRVLAPAKVNPWLRVLGRRDDGYRQVDTGLLALDWFDELAARPAPEPGLRLALTGPAATDDVPADERNLAWRAAAAVLERAPEGAGLELALTKRIPSRAGLGGGSSDGAAAALAACRALDLSLSWEELARIVSDLGSDCAFFLAARDSGFARCTGRGEVVESLAPVPDRWKVALVVPDIGADTGAVYAKLDRGLSPPAPAPNVSDLFGRTETGARSALQSDLESAALDGVPGLLPWRELLDQNGAEHFRLSGSGSSFFGLFGDARQASACLSAIETEGVRRALTPRACRVLAPAGHGVRIGSR